MTLSDLLLDVMGWGGSALLVFSLMQARVLRFRVLNLVACIVEWHVTAYDPSGAVLAQSIWRLFKVDSTKPIVVSKTPLGTAPLDANFVGTFNEKVRGVNGSTMRLRVSGSTTPVPVVVTLSADGKTATMNPNANLVPGKVYTAWFMNGIKDMAGNPLTSLTWKATAQ